MPCDGLAHGDLADGEVADAEGLPRANSIDAEYETNLDPRGANLCSMFGSLQVSDGFKRDEVIKRGPVSDSEFVRGDTWVEGGFRTTI